MRPAHKRVWYLIHKWTSLMCTVFLLLLSVTGLPLIFHEEIDYALGYRVSAPPVSAAGERASVDDIVSAAKARSPDERVQFVVRDPHEPDLWFVRLAEDINAGEPDSYFTYDARTGAFLNAYPLGQGVMDVLLRLHVDLFAGLPGTLFLGAMGLAFALALISGVVLYAPFMRKLPFGTVRSNRSARLRWLDWHNFLGIVTVVWALVVGVTGVINTLAIPVYGYWQSDQLAAMTAGHRDAPRVEQLASLDAVLAAAREAEPDMRLSFMAFPGNGFASPRHFTAFMQGTTPWTSMLLKPVMIDANTAEVTAKRALPWYVTALLLSQPLHFGDYGGLPLKLLWAALTLVTVVVLLTGLYLWLRPNARSERGARRPAAAHDMQPDNDQSPRGNGHGPLPPRRVWGAPIALGMLSAAGLTVALAGDGLWDAWSWLALAVPVAVCLTWPTIVGQSERASRARPRVLRR